MGEPALATVDGRRARAARTRESIVVSFIALLEEGDLRPTAAAVAERAGLSVRSVFQHFSDLEDLLLAVADRQTNRTAALYTDVHYDGDLDARIDEFVDCRARLFEAVAPVRRAAMLQEPFSGIVASRLELARSLHRLDVQRAFGAEFEAAAASGDPTLADALCTATCFTVWDEMRRFGGVDVETARATLRRVVAALLRPA